MITVSMRRLFAGLLLFGLSSFPALAQSSLVNKTQLFFGPGHGTQVEYLAKGGTSYLWYPGNRVILRGDWKTEGNRICFRYGANTYNPVTGQRGATWSCQLLSEHRRFMTESRTGDVLGLAGRDKPPFTLDSRQVTLAALITAVETGRKPEMPPPGKAITNAEADALCKAVVANADRSRADQVAAAHLYFHGMHMGSRCVRHDYAKSFALLDAAGDTIWRANFIRLLRERARGGMPDAQTALRRLGL
ncbi:hypothetical protein [Devosia enhydra]|uniref:hypothetical protein n=1 Tax=Devosia enhydra TaxID=665118 RepID=UPI001160B8CC|nr:hypothetical protein [Devosia enhydra]